MRNIKVRYERTSFSYFLFLTDMQLLEPLPPCFQIVLAGSTI